MTKWKITRPASKELQNSLYLWVNANNKKPVIVNKYIDTSIQNIMSHISGFFKEGDIIETPADLELVENTFCYLPQAINVFGVTLLSPRLTQGIMLDN
jgi:hypothetical protein